ncbi:LuxR C-terminal-related transcriptional regulator [Kutzneria chonburiensis]|uniref:LuxR C-terminal-related transcriptional regulator n=1 Tax=Kutzneria chonburiensis TaxID=1483604 RepID=A0ABV6MNM3_9PSEU|nr:response regulator transcription factor [Kutzneria chonburiensis]
MEEDRQPIRVAVISPVRVYVQGLAHLMAPAPDVTLAGTASGVDDAADLLERARADVILLDMTGDMAGERGLAALHRLTDLTAVPRVVLGIPDRPAEVVACAEAGIAGYVTNNHDFADLVEILRSATRGEFACQAGVAAGLVSRLAALARERRPTAGPSLTSRELEIVALIESGCSNKEIARLLHIQLTTVKNHVHNILEKLGVRGRDEAVAAVRRHYWSDGPALHLVAGSGRF